MNGINTFLASLLAAVKSGCKYVTSTFDTKEVARRTHEKYLASAQSLTDLEARERAWAR